MKDKKLKAFEWKSILKFLACEGEKAKAKVYRNRWLFFIPDYRKKPPYNLQEAKKAKERERSKIPTIRVVIPEWFYQESRAIKKNISLLPGKRIKQKIQKIGNTKLLVSPSLLES